MSDGRVIYFGCVEDRKDPLKLGRLKVRVVGVHDADKNVTPIKSLPWATPIQHITSAAVSGIGDSPTGLLEGSWVAVMFADTAHQQPLIIGSIAGIPQDDGHLYDKKNQGIKRKDNGVEETSQNGTFKSKKDDGTTAALDKSSKIKTPDHYGFKDPFGKYPKFFHESDVNRLARHDDTASTIYTVRLKAHRKNIKCAQGTTWTQPDIPYKAEYPFNHVRQTESGHTIELDDTKGAERTLQYHTAGTWVEVDSKGNEVHRVVGSNYEIIEKDGHVLIMGNSDLTIMGEMRVNVEKATKVDIYGKTTVNIYNDAKLYVKGNWDTRVDGTYNLSAGKIVINSDSTTNATSASTTTIKGSTIQLN